MQASVTSLILVVLFAAVSVVDLLIAALALRRGKFEGEALGMTCLGAFIVTVSYTVSLFMRDYFLYSILSSVYFAGIDFTLVSLMNFTWHFTRDGEQQKKGILFRLLSWYLLFDSLVMAINPFCEIVISYIQQGAGFAGYGYQMKLLYHMHLVYTYLLVAMILYYLISKVVRAPRIYRSPSIYCILTIAVIVGLNAIYLFVPGLFGSEDIDYSLLGYSLGVALFYWSRFIYSSHGLLSHFQSWIFQNLDQGLVLFDYDDCLILHNHRADELIPGTVLQNGMRLTEFMKKSGLKRGSEVDGLHYSFQCFIGGNAMRCDYSVQEDKKHKRLGRLFVFTPTATQFDLLTNFRSWADFESNADALFPVREEKEIAAVCDINSLTDINRKYSRTVGDQAIQLLATEMRACFPAGTFFTRSREAAIAAICTDCTTEQVHSCLQTVQEHMFSSKLLDEPIQIQSAVGVREDGSVLDTISGCLQSMRTKKLMDKTSIHSEMLRSLLQALSQCDADTGDHVTRTQKSGAELGKRIGLSDGQQSNLALLAILHDIGKIGIPLEILNKPGKLTDTEWKVLQTHAEKGYQIAKSSQELIGIADCILHHHERWDGKGYPDGLKEEQIPLLARIIAVVDAYDAMINDRAYRRAIPEGAARAELLRCAGTQFDPAIVREFVRMLEENDEKNGVVHQLPEQTVVPESVAAAQNDTNRSEPKHVFDIAYSVYTLDAQNRIVSFDDNFEALTGYSRGNVIDSSLTQLDMIYEEDREEYLTGIRRHGSQNEDVYLGHRIRRKDGTPVFVYCYGHRYYDSAEGEERTRIVIINSNAPIGTM